MKYFQDYLDPSIQSGKISNKKLIRVYYHNRYFQSKRRENNCIGINIKHRHTLTWDFKDFPALKFEMCNFRVLSKTWILCKSGKRIGSMKQYLILVLFEIFDRMFQFQMGSDSSGVCFKILPHWNWSSHSLSELQIPYFGGEYGSRNERFKVSRLAIGSSRWLVRLYWFFTEKSNGGIRFHRVTRF